MRTPQIFYLDNILRNDTFVNVQNELKSPIWSFGRVTNPDTWDEDDNIFWMADCTMSSTISDTAFYEIINKLNEVAPETTDWSWKMFTATAGGKTYGLDGGIHTDKEEEFNDMGDGYMTICYFPNEEWNPEWGGEFQFFNRDGDVIHTFYPKPNTALVFDSNIPHRGLAPTRNYKGLRIYISYKCFVNKKWYLEDQNNKDVAHIEHTEAEIIENKDE